MYQSLYSEDQLNKLLIVKKDPYYKGVINPAAKKILWLGKTAHMPDVTFQKVYFTKSVVATEFPQQTLGIDDFLFPCIAVSTPSHGNGIPK